MSTKAIALLMPLNAPRDGSNVRPGVPRLMAATGLSSKQVGIHLGRLEELGLLAVVRRGGGRGGEGNPTLYQLSMPAAGALPMVLDPAGRPVQARAKHPVPAGRPTRAAGIHAKPASPQSGAVPTFDVKPTSDETPEAPLIEVKRASHESRPGDAFDVKQASPENGFHAKPEADWGEAEDAMRRSGLRTISTEQVMNKPQSPLPSGDQTPERAGASTDPDAPAPLTYPAAVRILDQLDPDIADHAVQAAARQLRAEGREPTLRPLTIRAAEIAERLDPAGPDAETPDPIPNDEHDPDPDCDEGL